MSTRKVLSYEPRDESAAPSSASWLARFSKNGRDTTRTEGESEPTPVRAPDYDVQDMHGVVEKLRSEAIKSARADARRIRNAGDDADEVASNETELRERCRAVYERWRANARSSQEAQWADQEKALSEKMGRTALLIDRIQRLAHELKRTKARLSVRRQEVAREIDSAESSGHRGLSTRAYLIAVSFLGLVEYFANAPVFASLLPRDPLTERQIRLLTEVSQGWLAGAQRVFAQLLLRPDAALLALGVVTFLCVLGHFFGGSMRDLVTLGHQRQRRDTVAGRSPLEHALPMVLTGAGLALVIGVLFEARMTLGEVGEERYQEDSVVVAELRRDAGWLRVDGDLLAANEKADRADDMEAAALELREYSGSMARLSFPILLLNLTLVLCAISAAYYHRQVKRYEYFDDSTFEDERRDCVAAAEEASEEVTTMLGESTKHIRELKGLLAMHSETHLAEMAGRLDDVVDLYRKEKHRSLRGKEVPLPEESALLGLDVGPLFSGDHALHTPEAYEAEIADLRARFDVVRGDFNREATE